MTEWGMDNRLKIKLIMVVIALVFAFQSCGRKAPPIPPGAIVPPKVSGLSHAIEGDTLTLIWKAPQGKGANSVDGYDVMRSATSLDEKECPGCPIVFQRVARLGSSQTQFTDKLVTGKRYIYKVVAVTPYQVQGRDSKLIRFTYPEQKKEKEPAPIESGEEIRYGDDGEILTGEDPVHHEDTGEDKADGGLAKPPGMDE